MMGKIGWRRIAWLTVTFLMLFCSGAVAGGKGYKEIDSKTLKAMMDKEDVLVVFPLSRIEFNDMHITGSVHIPLHELAENLPADKKQKIVFYCLGIKCTASWRAAGKAMELGYQHVYAFREGLPAWLAAGFPVESLEPLPRIDIEKISTDELQAVLSSKDEVVLLDVCLKRDAEKFWIGSNKRIHIPADELPDRVGEVPRDKKVVVICLKGKRSPTIVRYLHSKGYKNLVSVEGGMTRWILDGRPVEKKKS